MLRHPILATLLMVASVAISIAANAHLATATKHRSIHVATKNREIDANVLLDRKKHPNPRKVYYWFDNTSIHQTQGGYAGYVLDGRYQEFYYPAKSLFSTGNFYNGLKTGKWNTWFEDGTPRQTERWRHGRLDGILCVYDNSGQLHKKEVYRKGILYGRYLYTNDSLTRREFFYKGVSQPQRLTVWQHLHWAKSSSSVQPLNKNVSVQPINPPANSAAKAQKKKSFWLRLKNIF